MHANLNELLAPCGKSRIITDRETGYIAGASVMLFKTFNGSNRYVYQVAGRSVAVLHIKASQRRGELIGMHTLDDYANAGLFRILWGVARHDFDKLKLSDVLGEFPQLPELLTDLKNIYR